MSTAIVLLAVAAFFIGSIALTVLSKLLHLRLQEPTTRVATPSQLPDHLETAPVCWGWKILIL